MKARLLATPTPRRIHQGFGSIGQLNSGASSVYNSLQVQVQRRFSRGLTFKVAYTYGRAIDEVLTSSAFATVTQNGLQDPNNRDAERGRGDFDLQQRMVSSFLYEIPAPRHRVAACAGWLGAGFHPDFRGRPPVPRGRGQGPLAHQRPARSFADRWQPPLAVQQVAWREGSPNGFNPDAFALAAVGSFGNSGRNNLQGPGLINMDISLRKRFQISEGHSVDFRVDFFNLPNRPNFGTPRRGSATDRRLGRHYGRTFRTHRPVLAQVLVLARGLLESERPRPLERTREEAFQPSRSTWMWRTCPRSPIESCTCPLTTRGDRSCVAGRELQTLSRPERAEVAGLQDRLLSPASVHDRSHPDLAGRPQLDRQRLAEPSGAPPGVRATDVAVGVVLSEAPTPGAVATSASSAAPRLSSTAPSGGVAITAVSEHPTYHHPRAPTSMRAAATTAFALLTINSPVHRESSQMLLRGACARPRSPESGKLRGGIVDICELLTQRADHVVGGQPQDFRILAQEADCIEIGWNAAWSSLSSAVM